MPDPIQGPVAVLTGAGISAESGVPTFRGESGLWHNFRPEQLATGDAFRRDPVLVWDAHHTLDSVVVPQPGFLVPDLDRIGLSKEDLRAIGLPGWHAPQGRHTPAATTENAIVSETAIPERGLSVVWTLDQSLRVTSYRIRDSEGKWLGTVEIVDGAPKLLRPD